MKLVAIFPSTEPGLESVFGIEVQTGTFFVTRHFGTDDREHVVARRQYTGGKHEDLAKTPFQKCLDGPPSHAW